MKDSRKSVLVAASIAAMVVAAAAQERKPLPACRDIDASIRVVPAALRTGTQPRFTLVLRNASKNPVRLVNIRDGRRQDLAHSYYEILFERNGRELKDVPRAISDPGPLDAADFFELAAGAAVETPLTTPADLTRLPVGHYSAYVRITVDPFDSKIPKCRSSRTAFTVGK